MSPSLPLSHKLNGNENNLRKASTASGIEWKVGFVSSNETISFLGCLLWSLGGSGGGGGGEVYGSRQKENRGIPELSLLCSRYVTSQFNPSDHEPKKTNPEQNSNQNRETRLARKGKGEGKKIAKKQ